MPPSLHSEGVSIVLLGSLNPAIFHPAWFARHRLLRDGEVESAEVTIISPEVTEFTVDWLHLRAHQKGFEVVTARAAQYEAMRDLVLGTFAVLEHTPLLQLGMNYQVHYGVSSEEHWHAIGDLLSPKAFWQSQLERPGLRSLTMEGVRTDGMNGHLQVTVEPSVRVRPGVYIRVNDHVEASANGDGLSSARELMAVLAERWVESGIRARRVAESIMELEA